MNYRIIRSKRKTLALEITRQGEVLVRAPLRVSAKYIQKFFTSQQAWLLKKLEGLKSIKPREYKEGETFWYLGESYDLRLVERRKPLLDLHNHFLLARSAQVKAREIFMRWYKAEAKALIQDRVEHYSRLMGLACNHIRITQAQTRWGSCSRKNNINFSFSLIMAPQEVIDYVVVHELAHIKEKNHSRRFWTEVAQIIPDYKKLRKWLKDNGSLLGL
jgi:predicted metal-dependent hydrolase